VRRLRICKVVAGSSGFDPWPLGPEPAYVVSSSVLLYSITTVVVSVCPPVSLCFATAHKSVTRSGNSQAHSARHRVRQASELGTSGAPSSARRSLDQLADLFLDVCSEPLKGKRGWPDVSVVEVCSVLETERCVSRLELLPALEKADNLAVLGVRGHPVPGFR